MCIRDRTYTDNSLRMDHIDGLNYIKATSAVQNAPAGEPDLGTPDVKAMCSGRVQSPKEHALLQGYIIYTNCGIIYLYIYHIPNCGTRVSDAGVRAAGCLLYTSRCV